MNGKQHQIVGIGFGIAGAYAGVKLTGDFTALSIAVGAGISCWWADGDHNSTKLGRKRKAVVSTANKVIDLAVTGTLLGSGAAIVLNAMGKITLGNYSTPMLIECAICVAWLVLTELVTNSSGYKWATKHRGIMHTLLMPTILLIASTAVDQSLWRFLFYGFTLGYLSHLLSDSVTPGKVPALWPITTKPVGIVLVKHDKVPKDDKAAKKEADEKFKKQCTRLAYILAVGACVLSLIIF